MLFELLYKDRLLVDYADKELSIWPTAGNMSFMLKMYGGNPA